MALYLNGDFIDFISFPDKTKLIEINPINGNEAIIRWNYEDDEGEAIFLLYVVEHLRDNGFTGDLILELPYVPNARMDRVTGNQVFTLKYFAKFINWLGFKEIRVCDVHSSETIRQLTNVVDLQGEVLSEAFEIIKKELGNFQLFFPDESAYERYKNFFPGVPYLYGKKNKIPGYGGQQGPPIIVNPTGMELDFSLPVLAIDDICAYGGSCYYAFVELEKMGFSTFYVYVTHCERSAISSHEKAKLLRMKSVRGLYTISGLMTETDVNNIQAFEDGGVRNKIRVLELFGKPVEIL